MTKSVPMREQGKPPERKPQCQEKSLTVKGTRRQCSNDGAHCWVSGEFGRQAMVLCNPHIKELRDKGWTVRYQIEGDNPPPLADELMGESK